MLAVLEIRDSGGNAFAFLHFTFQLMSTRKQIVGSLEILRKQSNPNMSN